VGDSAVSAREFNAKVGFLAFSLEWRLTLFTLLLTPALITLGFWQLERAEQKRMLSEQHAFRAALPPITLAEAVRLSAENLAELRDRRIAFSGTAVAQDYLLLDNRLNNGQFGYEVIALIQAGNYRVPVNLGWLPGDPARRVLPTVTLPIGEQQWMGWVYAPKDRAYTLGEQPPPDSLPTVIQSYEAAEYAGVLAAITAARVPVFMVRVDRSHPAAWVADWPVINQTPEKHTAYAVQWFMMAAVLFCAFVLRSSNIGSLLLGRRPSKLP
jgi:surfeit locus 1 family protein